MDPLSDAKIIDSWEKNAASWTRAVRENRIASRSLVTNEAILDAVTGRSPRTVLDIGCGEGWLVRALTDMGIAATGIDAIPELIEQAARAGGGDFRVMSYEEIAASKLDFAADVVVANFSLIGNESVEGLLRRAPGMLSPGGALIVQTIHPETACGDNAYADGWRQGSWAGFTSDFSDPAPWYFRTMPSWLRLFAECGFSTVEVREPMHPDTNKPASVIFLADCS